MGEKTAFITGITGQDGAYLSEFLLNKCYSVHGLVRWDCVDATSRLPQSENLRLHFGDMSDANSLNHIIKAVQPDEIYNLAALSHVKVSFETPASALDINAGGTLNVLESVRLLGLQNRTRIYQASSSEMFGAAPAPQNENTPMHPCSPYGVAKLAAYHLARIYREAYGLHVSNGILFNHESPLRGEDFVTRKITRAVAAIEAGAQETLMLGNLNSLRDWGHARDYVEGMWMMLRQDEPGDYILATGKAYSVRQFTERAFAHAGMKIEWRGSGPAEQGIDAKTGRVLVAVDRALFRPLEVNHLLGNAAKAHVKLGWHAKTDLDALVADMINADRAAYHEEVPASWRKMAG